MKTMPEARLHEPSHARASLLYSTTSQASPSRLAQGATVSLPSPARPERESDHVVCGDLQVPSLSRKDEIIGATGPLRTEISSVDQSGSEKSLPYFPFPVCEAQTDCLLRPSPSIGGTSIGATPGALARSTITSNYGKEGPILSFWQAG